MYHDKAIQKLYNYLHWGILIYYVVIVAWQSHPETI